VVVSGEAAIGKTALSQHFLGRHRTTTIRDWRAEANREPTYERARMRGNRTSSRLLENGNTPLSPDKRSGSFLSRRRHWLTRAMSRPCVSHSRSSSALVPVPWPLRRDGSYARQGPTDFARCARTFEEQSVQPHEA